MISVVVPVHDEERSVALLHDELDSALQPLGEPWEAVFVDDGSTDGTHAALTRLHAAAANVVVVRLRRNFGKAAALAAGFAQAKGDMIVTIDGDLQDDPAEIPKLLAKLDEGFDLVSGWKTKRRDPLRRRIPSRLFNAVTGWVSGVHLHDMNCGLKAYRAEVVRGLRLYGELHRFIPVLAHHRGYRIAEVPVNHRPREHGRSRYGLERYLRGFFDLLTVSFIGRYRQRPLHLFGGLGLLLSFAGAAILVYLTVVKALGHAIGGRPLLILGVLLVVVGIQFFSLGPDHRADHQPPRGAGVGARAVGGDGRGDPLLRVLYFGTYERSYPRNAQVISCLRRAGVEVAERHEAVWDGREHKFGAGAGAALRLAAAEVRCSARAISSSTRSSSATPGTSTCRRRGGSRRAGPWSSIRSSPSPTRSSAIAAGFGRSSPAARALETIDRRAFGAADLVVADTAAQAPFFRSLGARHVEICFVGAEERLFMPGWARPAEGEFTALFVGKLIPLHGLETILGAARLAPELRFRVVGSGQLQPLLDRRPPNVEHLNWVDYELLPGELYRTSCALGIFGTSAKAARVIPNKAFQALACGTPLVTAETPAAQELLRDGESALLVPPGDPHALATALRRLAADEELARRLSIGGLAAYREHASEDVLGARWRELIASLL